MKHHTLLLYGCVLGASLLYLSGCSSDEPTAPSPDGGTISQILTEAGKVVPPQDQDLITQSDTTESGSYRYIAEKHDVVDNIESITFLGLNDDVVWPGNLIKGDRANDFIYEPISIDRNPITLSINLEGATTGDTISQIVNDPKLSTVRQGIHDLLRNAVVTGTHVPAKADFVYQQVFSESQMNLFVKANVKGGGGSLDTKFDWSSTSRKNKIMAKYQQIYYTVNVDAPQYPANWFASTNTTQGLRTAMPAGSFPLYVAGVSYGMMALMFIETDFNQEEMNLALDAAYHGTFDATLDFGYSAKQVLQSSSVKIVVYGGSTAGLDSLYTGYQGFLQVIQASKDFTSESPGVPLVYHFRHVCDNTLALVTLTSQYTLIRPIKLRQIVRILAVRFKCLMADDEGLDNTVDMDRFKIWSTCYVRAGTDSPYVLVSPVDQEVYIYEGGNQEMDAGSIHECNSSIDVTFDTEHYNFPLSKISLKAYCRDDDGGWSANEEDTRSIDVMGDQFLTNPHVIDLYSADFHFQAEVNITLVSSSEQEKDEQEENVPDSF
jgi:hypothetical protein